MNGWAYAREDNKSAELRRDIISKHNSDIYAICETHLRNDSDINVDGYKWYGHNRTELHGNAIRGSGGVGFLISDSILVKYDAHIIDNSCEGILWLKLTAKGESELYLLLCVCYLPPEGSSRGNWAQAFYEALLAQIYLHYDGSPLVICGDYNGRMGVKQDCEADDTGIPQRVPLDTIVNKFGDHLLDFISDARLAMLNGRFDAAYDNYTFVSSRGRSVVDYMLVPAMQLQYVSDFRVTTVTEAIDEYAITPHSLAKAPDHSILTCTLSLSQYEHFKLRAASDSRSESRGSGGGHVHRRYKVNMLPQDMFLNERCARSLHRIISSLQARHLRQQDIDDTYQDFMDTLHGEMDDTLEYKDLTPGIKRRHKHSKPYWNATLKALWNEARYSEQQYLRCRDRQCRHLKDTFIRKRHVFDKALRREERRYNIQQQEHIFKLKTDNPRAFWQELGKLGPGQKLSGVSQSVILEDGSVTDDPDIVLDKWKHDFSQLYRAMDNTSADNEEFLERMQALSAQWEREYEDIVQGRVPTEQGEDAERVRQASLQLNGSITRQETITAIRDSRNGKAVGIDNVASEILKIPHLHSTLHKLYVACFENNVIPSIWYKAIIHPLLKKGQNPMHPLGHRGISLMSCVAKIFSSILNNRLVSYMESNGIFVDEQNGFRRLRSCLDHLYVLTTIIRNRKEQGLSTYCCFVDFEKAFDSVNYNCLWHKLLAYGVHGSMLEIMRTLYANLQNCVKVNGRITDWFAQSSGVRQGDTLAPTLFAVFINDLALEINAMSAGVTIQPGETVSILMYADDIVLLAESAESLQLMMDKLAEWSRDWMLRINHSKTKVVHFRKASHIPTDFTFRLGEQIITRDEQYRYLGLDMCDTLDLTHGVNVLNRSASRALGALTSKYYKLDGLPHTVFKKMFDCMVAPVQDYASEIWGVKPYACCDTTQHRAMRTYLGVGRCTPLPGLYGDLQWASPHTRHQLAAVTYWLRLTRMPCSRLTRRVFDWDHGLAARGRRSWNRDIKLIFNKCSLGDVFDDKAAGTVPHGSILSCARETLLRTERARRSETAGPMSRMRLFRDIWEDSVEPAHYVKNSHLGRRDRSLLARLRCGTLPLSIETGRYRQIPRDDRLCSSCNTRSIETEEHFLFECSKFADYRAQYIDVHGDCIGTLRDIFQCSKRSKDLALYIHKALLTRNK